MCCDSAHKTLPVLTGGAYLHISKNAPEMFSRQAENALSLFASTSPSYLILQSLDYANKYLAEGYRENLTEFLEKMDSLRECLVSLKYTLVGSEPLKITIDAKKYAYTGNEMAEILYHKGIVCEFADPDDLEYVCNADTNYKLIVKFKNGEFVATAEFPELNVSQVFER